MSNRDDVVLRGGGRERLHGLDLFRIGLALSVFAFHDRMHMGCSFGRLNYFLNVGALAMTGFFMLSGFVIYHMYAEEDFSNVSNVKRFWVKRMSSVWPLMVFAGYLAVLLRIMAGSRGVLDSLLVLPVEIVGLSSVFNSLSRFGHTDGTWFVSCIFICYLLFPFAQMTIRHSSNRWRLVVLLVASSFLMYAPVVLLRFHLNKIYTNPVLRFFEFLVGMLLASGCLRIKIQVPCDWVKKGYAVLPIVFIHVVTISLLSRFCFGGLSIASSYSISSACSLPFFAAEIMLLSKMESLYFLKSRVVAYCSDCSYAFFMSQLICFMLSRKILYYCASLRYIECFVSFLLCCGIAVTMYELVQRPSKKYLIANLLRIKND